MKQSDARSAITERSSRALRRIVQNNQPRDLDKPHLAKHGLKGEHHGRSRHPA